MLCDREIVVRVTLDLQLGIRVLRALRVRFRPREEHSANLQEVRPLARSGGRVCD